MIRHALKQLLVELLKQHRPLLPRAHPQTCGKLLLHFVVVAQTFETAGLAHGRMENRR